VDNRFNRKLALQRMGLLERERTVDNELDPETWTA
jgi:hypothetical protein